MTPLRAGSGLLLALAVLQVAPLRSVAAAAPQAGGSRRQAEAYHLYSLAQQSLLDRDYLHALDRLQEAASRDEAPAILVDLAQLRYALNDLDGASSLVVRVLAAEPKNSDALKLMGDIHLLKARDGVDVDANVAGAIAQYETVLAVSPTDSDAARSLAELYFHTGKVQEAGDLLRGLGKKRALGFGLSILLAKIDARTGRFSEAEDLLRGVLARAPGNQEVADTLAAVHEAQEEFDQAIAVYAGLMAQVGPSAAVLDRVGSLHLAAGRSREAIGVLEQAQRLDARDNGGLLLLARAYEEAGELVAARERCDALLRREPDNLEALLRRAILLRKTGSPAAALKDLDDVVERASARGALTEKDAAVLGTSYVQIGVLKMEANDFAAAAAAFEEALDLSEEPGAELFLLLGRAFLDGRKFADAERVATEGARRHPDDDDLSVFRGEVLAGRGDGVAARAWFADLLQRKDHAAASYAGVAEALIRQKRYETAEGFLKEAVRLHPADDSLAFARGAVLERLGRVSEAERALGAAIRINPRNALALNYLGFMLADRGERLQESITYIERALALDPQNSAFLDSLGWAQFKMSRYEAAEKSLRAAVSRDDIDPTIREHLGDLLMETGRPDEALREWEDALARGHEDPDRVRRKMSRARTTAAAPR